MLLAVASACGPADSSRTLDITARLSPGDSLFGAVEVRGLSKSSLKTLGHSLLLVQASELGDTTADLPPVAGRYVMDGDVLRFEPRYRPAGELQLRVTLTADSVLTREFRVPAEAMAPPSTAVVAVFPSADTVAANHLRWYIEFSAPMREGEAEANIQLLDTKGKEVRDAFLIVSEELWDPERRRLTLLFDPGRVKRGLRQNLESGAPLVAGRDYTLKIDSDWRDGRGANLASGFEKRFHVSEAIRTRLDPASWRIGVPRVGTREPVTIDFGRAVDRALAERLVEVVVGQGRVTGTVGVVKGERVWQLEPERPWSGREYEVRVSSILEDPAGNTVMASFDRDAGEWREGDAGQGVTLRFRPLLYSSARAR